jgi:hypothetical protein
VVVGVGVGVEVGGPMRGRAAIRCLPGVLVLVPLACLCVCVRACVRVIVRVRAAPQLSVFLGDNEQRLLLLHSLHGWPCVCVWGG